MMLALKWGAVAVSALSGVLFGTYKLVNHSKSISFNNGLTNLDHPLGSDFLSRPVLVDVPRNDQVNSQSISSERSILVPQEALSAPSTQLSSVIEETTPFAPPKLEESNTTQSQQSYKEEISELTEEQKTEDSTKLDSDSSPSKPVIEEIPTTSVETNSQGQQVEVASEEQSSPKENSMSSKASEDLSINQEVNTVSPESKSSVADLEEFKASGSQIAPIEAEPTINSSPEIQLPSVSTPVTAEIPNIQVTTPVDSQPENQLKESSSEQSLQVSDVEAKVVPIAPPKPRQLTKEEIKAQADSIFGKLDDYTFKLFSSCNTGSGWILDYQIPDQKDKYPLVWYIATNAHVVNYWHFDQTNPYKQILPTKLNAYTRKWQDYYTNYASRYYPLASSDNCYYKTYYGAFDMNLSKQSSGKALKSNWGAIHQRKIKRPKLFWAALNLFEKNDSYGIKENNFQDFVVLEIEFTNEKHAREMTRNFATKYTVESNNAINIFGNPISRERAIESNENFYGLGYSGKSKDKFSYSKTWNPNTLEGEKLFKDPRKRETNSW